MKKAALIAIALLSGCAHVEPALVTPLVTIEHTPRPGLHVTERTVRYAVRGHSVRALSDEMSRIGPIDDGRHQFAHTWGNFAWRWPYAEGQGHCATGPVSIELEIVQTVPSWVDRGGAQAHVAREWDRWLAATLAHEAQHRAILVDTAGALAENLVVAPQASCDAVDTAAGERGQAALTEMRRRHAELDRQTQHGASTGARLKLE